MKKNDTLTYPTEMHVIQCQNSVSSHCSAAKGIQMQYNQMSGCKFWMSLTNILLQKHHKNQRQKVSLAAGLRPQHVQPATNSNSPSLIKSISWTPVRLPIEDIFTSL